ncbi:MAG: Flp pilus assembly complex ATPase component TadA, partial [Smithella sp.]|nr:Flp pilus assembly complex ATPase component TadA [Smithella sp.]
MKIKKRLGEMLIDEGLISHERLTQALEEQKKAGLKLGQFLTRMGIVSESQIIDLLSRQLKISRYHPDEYPLEIDLADHFTIEVAQKHQISPLKKKGRLLTIAMVDPLDINALDYIEVLTNSEVEPVVCSERGLNQLISSLYGTQSGLGSIMENMEIKTQEEGQQEAQPDKEEIQVASLQDMAGEAPVVRLANSIFAQAIRDGASDVHISPQQNSVQLRFRIDGKLMDVPSPPKSLFLPIIARMKILSNMDITISRIPQDGRFTLKLDKKE